MRILVAEDDKAMNRVIEKRLRLEGYSVDTCFDGEEALYYLECAAFDAAILDIMMPKMDGYGVVKKMQEKGIETPVIFLTAKDTIEDKVTGLDLGASDYLVKPFSFEELLARIRVMVRKQSRTQSSTYEVGNLTVDTSAHRVTREGKEIILTAKEFALLEVLVRHQGQALTREQIENNLWNFDYGGGTNVIDVYIRYLRKKIDDPFDTKLIHTVRGVGYMLREDI